MDDVALFSVPPVNVAQDKISFVNFLPCFTKPGKDAFFQFDIPGVGDQYTDLSRTMLYMKVRIEHPNGTFFVQDRLNSTTAIPIDNIMHSCFSQVEIYANGNLISTSGTNYPYKSYIENLLNFNKAATDMQLSFVGFTGDVGNFAATDPNAQPYTSQGLNKRFQWWKALPLNKEKKRVARDKDAAPPTRKEIEEMRNTYDSVAARRRLPPEKVWYYLPRAPDDDDQDEYSDPTADEFKGKLMADICGQDRAFLNGVSLQIKLWPTSDAFRLITHPPGTVANLIIDDVRLEVCKVTMANSTIIGIEETLSKTPALYPYLRTEMRSFNITKGNYKETIEDPFNGEVPTRMIVGMVNAHASAGDYSLNPFYFQHYNIASIGFTVNGESTPRERYEFNFRDCNYLEGLMSLYEVTGKLGENTDIGIDRKNYRQGLTLIGFEVDPTTSGNHAYLGKRKSGRTCLSITFHKALKKNITLIMYATFPEVMQIDQNRVVCLREKERSIALLRANTYMNIPTIAPVVPAATASS